MDNTRSDSLLRTGVIDPPDKTEKQAARCDIEQATADFLARGGEIESLAMNQGANTPEREGRPYTTREVKRTHSGIARGNSKEDV